MTTAQNRRRYRIAGLIALGFLALAGVVAGINYFDPFGLPPLEIGYDGPSTGLRQTVVLPTLDSPIPDGTSAVWCGSFQLAWNDLEDLAGGPVRVAGRDELAGRLNASSFSSADLSTGTYYSAAGLTRDGIGPKIRADMGRQFPGVPVPELDPADAAFAYAYLRASVPFRLAYFEDQLPFESADGTVTPVRAFGIREEDEGRVSDLRSQIEVLFTTTAAGSDDWQPIEFALDLDRESSPDQLIVARLPRGRTLKDLVNEVEERAARARKASHGDSFSRMDQLLVPVMAWRVEHRYAELEGPDRRLGGGKLDGLYIHQAYQMIQFRLDRNGADLTSEARVHLKGGPRKFHCDGPYLLYLKRRGAAVPYFAMWVDNAELLTAWK